MTVGLFDESLGLEKSFDGFGFLGQKFEACFSADPAETEVANHAVNAVLFILGPFFGVAGGIQPIPGGIVSHAPGAEGILIGPGAGFFEDGLHGFELVGDEKLVGKFRGVAPVIVGVSHHTGPEKALCRGRFEGGGVTPGA